MKLNKLSGILHSGRGNIQMAIVYDTSSCADIESGCSIEYAIEQYGDREVKQIQAEANYLVICI